MSDEDKENRIDEEVVEENLEELPEGSETEEQEGSEQDSEVVERAKKYGHLSKEEWVAAGKDPSQWKTPEEFDKTGKVIEQIYSLKKQVEQRDRELKAVIAQQERIAKREYEKARQDLEARLAASKEDMDMEGVAQHTKELIKLEELEQQNQYNNQQRAKKEAQEAFLERNQHWFNDRNPDLQQRAIEIDNEIKQKYPTASYSDLADMIEAKMLKEYPERILGTQKVSRPIVSSSSVNKTAITHNSSKKVFQSLSQELKDTYNAHKRIRASMGQELTEAEFIERLKAYGEI